MPNEHESDAGVPGYLAAYAAALFTFHPEQDPHTAWTAVAERMQAITGLERPWKVWQARAAEWAARNVPPPMLLHRRWF